VIGFWIAAGALVAVSVGLIVRAMNRRAAVGGGEDLAVYRDQLRELERDRARGSIGSDEAEAARAEIERRALAAAEAGDGATDPRPAPRLALALALLLPAAALAIYLQLGAPGVPGQPLADRGGVSEEAAAQIAAARDAVDDAPESAEAWIGLAHAYRTAQRYEDAAEALARAVELGATGQIPAYGEALAMAARGVVTERAAAAFEEARRQGSRDPRVPFYLGMARAQGGDPHGALELWLRLEARSAPDAPWLPALRAQIEQAAEAAGMEPGDLDDLRAALAAETPKPTREDIEAAGEMSEADRAAMIEDMVAGLAARLEQNPDDLAGWLRLGRSYMVLERPEDAARAYARAAELAPDEVRVLVDYGEAMLASAGDVERLPPEFVALMRRILSLDPENPVALWFVGVAEMEAGNAHVARTHWQTLLDGLPPEAPERAELERRIEAIEQGG